MKIVATIEARMTSSRLPGKVLLPVQGKPMLYHLVNRLKAVPSINEIVLATTINSTDDVLIDFAKQESILSYRGSEEDVMSRVIGAAETADADVIVEITGDCPIIDPDKHFTLSRADIGVDSTFSMEPAEMTQLAQANP